jgi:hypothetical protein
VQWLDLASCLWPPLVKLPLANTFQDHYDIMVKCSKPHLSSSLRNYYWFLQYMNNDNGDDHNNQPPLGMHFKSFHFFFFIFQVIFQVITFIDCIYFLVLTFVCSWFGLLFTNYMMLFIAKREKMMLATQVFILR